MFFFQLHVPFSSLFLLIKGVRTEGKSLHIEGKLEEQTVTYHSE